MKAGRIITVGISPAWDVKCVCGSVGWGEHVSIDGKTVVPAGKALNVSKALAWMGVSSLAMGLWGDDDHSQMQKFIHAEYGENIKLSMTKADGCTRRNIWIVDKKNQRELHLRDSNDFITEENLTRVFDDIKQTVRSDDTVVFAGSMPVEAVEMVADIIKAGAKVVIDTSGDALREVANLNGVFAIKPNVDELGDLSGGKIEDSIEIIIDQAKKFLNSVENVLVTRGGNGAVLVGRSGIYKAFIEQSDMKVIGTVGCGDYFLAGFLAGLARSGNYTDAIEMALLSGSGRAYGLDDHDFSEVGEKLKIQINKQT